MKIFKGLLLLLILTVGFLYFASQKKEKSHFVITADTNVSKVKGLSKYVSQEEVNDFAFRYWDIDSNYTKNIPPKLIPLRAYLKQKNTNKIINYIKEHNLSIDVKIQDGTTPLMYSSFYNDTNTSKYLIKNKANIHQKDRYGLSPLAYAIENNSTKTVKLLLDSGVRVEELKKVQFYLVMPSYRLIDKLIIDGDKITTVFKEKVYKKARHHNDGEFPFHYIVRRNFIELAKLVLESGYKPKINIGARTTGLRGTERTKSNINLTVYTYLGDYPNYKPMLDLLLKYNVVGKPDKEVLQEAYDKCYGWYNWYKIRWIRGDNINKKRPFYVDMPIKHYEKYCNDKNGTFKDARAFIDWANSEEMMTEIIFISTESPNKVIYKDNNISTRVINKIEFKINQTKEK